MDRRTFKSKPYHIKQKTSGEITKTIHSSDTDIGTETLPADLNVYGNLRVYGTSTLDNQTAVASDSPTVLAGTGAPSTSTGADGDYYIDTSTSSIYGPKTAGSWSSSSTVLGSGWRTALDLNFAAETSQTFSSDTTYTIAGKTWTKFNSINDNVSMAIVNGSGLVIQPKSTSDYNGATRTFPGISVPLSSLDSTIPLTARVRCYMYISTQNIAANYDSAIMAIDSQSSNVCYATKYGRNVAGIGMTVFMNALTSNLGFKDVLVSLGSSSNVLMLDIPKLGHPALSVFYAAGTGGVLPADTTFLYGSSYDYVNAALGGLTTSNMALTLGAQRAGSGTSLSITIARVKVLWKE